jgi:hypothetical protein
LTLFKVATSTIILHDTFTVHLRRKVKGRRKLGIELEGEAREPLREEGEGERERERERERPPTRSQESLSFLLLRIPTFNQLHEGVGIPCFK